MGNVFQVHSASPKVLERVTSIFGFFFDAIRKNPSKSEGFFYDEKQPKDSDCYDPNLMPVQATAYKIAAQNGGHTIEEPIVGDKSLQKSLEFVGEFGYYGSRRKPAVEVAEQCELVSVEGEKEMIKGHRISRRAFIRSASLAAAGSVAGALAGAGCTAGAKANSASESKIDTSKILNYNPQMGYRRLGKTGLLISEVSLGGHGSLGLQNRIEVLQRAAELGMNYLDTNITEECELYGKALSGKRDNWHIGFASWPQKLTAEYEQELSKERFVREIDGRLKHYKTDMLDIWRPVGATWGEGQTSIPTMLMVSHQVLDMVVEVFEKVQQQGKVRWLGISAHNPKVFRRVLNEYPQFSVIIFPYLFLTEELGGDSLLALAREKDVGVIGLKPFGAGTTFGIKPQEIHGKVDKHAHVLIQKMLQEPRLSAIIPGVNTTDQLEENVIGSYERDKPLTFRDREAIRQCSENYYANLTHEYQWLRNWETV